MLRAGLLAVTSLLFLVARCSNADFAAALGGLPVVGPIVQPAPSLPSYVAAIGTPAPATLPEATIADWFAPAPADPVATWRSAAAFLAAAGTKDGWTAACKKVGETAGANRAANPELGALACSKDGRAVPLQQLALHLLQARASAGLAAAGAPEGTIVALQARQAEVRLDCAVSGSARPVAVGSPLATACARSLETAYLDGDVAATFAALGEAYSTIAAEIARIAPAIDPEPGWSVEATK